MWEGQGDAGLLNNTMQEMLLPMKSKANSKKSTSPAKGSKDNVIHTLVL